MLVKESHFFVESNRDQHFTESLVAQASEYENLLIGDGHGFARTWITSVRLHTATNHAWAVVFNDRDTQTQRLAATPYNNTIIDYVEFAAGDALPTASEWVYAMTGLKIPYTDKDATGEIHVGLINRSTSTKGALGATLPSGVNPQYVTLKIGVIGAA